MKERKIRPKAAVNALAMPTHRFALVNGAADRAVLQQPRLEGERLFRRHSHFAAPEVYERTLPAGSEADTEVPATTMDTWGGHVGARAWVTGGVVCTETTAAHTAATNDLHINKG